MVWQAWADMTFYGGNVIADVLPGIAGSEIVTGSGDYTPYLPGGRWIKIFSLATGQELRSLTLPAGGSYVVGSPAIADLDDDDLPDIIAVVDAQQAGKSQVAAWRPSKSSSPWWSYTLSGDNMYACSGLRVALLLTHRIQGMDYLFDSCGC